MSLLEDNFDSFIEEQERRVEREIDHWKSFKEDNPEGVYLAFSEQRREGQHHVRENRLKEERANDIREYLKLPDVAKVGGIWVDLLSLQVPYNCMHKSCKLTGKYCCKVTSCTANTEFSQHIMREAGQELLDMYDDEQRVAAIRRGDTHTDKLSHNRTIDGICVFGEEKQEDGSTHIHCNLHEAAYERNIPMHWLHSIGPSLFPIDILIVDGEWFITAASERAKEHRATRWWVTSESTICTNHGDSKPTGILQHPDFDAMFRDIFGEPTIDAVQEEAYGQVGPVEPEITDGWLHADERGLTEYNEECRNCEGSGCEKCDGRGYFVNWK